jgi:hypothetical protein
VIGTEGDILIIIIDRKCFFGRSCRVGFNMAMDLITAIREKTRVDRQRQEDRDDAIEMFEKIPEAGRLEDLKIGTLLNE